MTAYYNEIEPFAAQWLRNLIAAGHIAPGDVDERSIVDVRPDDLRGYAQCHFFAGIGVWSHALRTAGWADDRPVWTGSAPCQPFSAAGRKRGTADERHLWPAWFALIKECRPDVIFGEQVASPDVIGKNLQKLRKREVNTEFSQAKSGWIEKDLQGLRERACKDHKTLAIPKTTDLSEETTSNSSRLCVDKRRMATSEGKGDTLQPGLEGHPGTYRRGFMRSDGITLRSDLTEVMECPLTRPDRPPGRIHPRKHSGRTVCPEYHGEHLGLRSDFGHCGGDPKETVLECVERLISSIVRELPETNGGAWLDIVQFDLERANYTLGTSVLAACSVGSPHLRQRLYWVAESGRQRRAGVGLRVLPGGSLEDRPEVARRAAPSSGDVADAERGGSGEGRRRGRGAGPVAGRVLGYPAGEGLAVGPQPDERSGALRIEGPAAAEAGVVGGFWRDADLIWCTDGRYRPVEPSIFPLAHGVAGRVGQLRAAGNAIVAPLATEFIRAYLDTLG